MAQSKGENKMSAAAYLTELFQKTNGKYWNNSMNWCSLEPVENWFGVTVRDRRVVDISLPNNNLSGLFFGFYYNKLFILIFCFSKYITFFLIRNHHHSSSFSILSSFVGNIPDSFGKLTSLTKVDFSTNKLEGVFPKALLLLESLDSLDISNNLFSGPVPDGLTSLGFLTSLNLKKNKFSGELPKNIGKLCQLKSLNFGDNELTGKFLLIYI